MEILKWLVIGGAFLAVMGFSAVLGIPRLKGGTRAPRSTGLNLFFR
jgi:hypothetical protein